MQKYLVNKIKDNLVSFDKKDEHHILNVMRYSIADKIIAIYKSKKYLCRITSINPLFALVIEEIIENVSNPFIIDVYQSNIKPKYMEMAIVKACEMNVDNFYIFNSDYSQLKSIHNLERYKRIIKESTEQCNRNNPMNIFFVKQDELEILFKENDVKFIANFSENKNFIEDHINKNIKSIGIIIGPEGGFTENDLKFLITENTYIINLTRTILRSETALLYLTSVVSYLMLKEF